MRLCSTEKSYRDSSQVRIVTSKLCRRDGLIGLHLNHLMGLFIRRRYVAPENIPIEYGGLKRKNDCDFVPGEEKIKESYVRGGAKCRIEIPVIEVCSQVLVEVKPSYNSIDYSLQGFCFHPKITLTKQRTITYVYPVNYLKLGG